MVGRNASHWKNGVSDPRVHTREEKTEYAILSNQVDRDRKAPFRDHRVSLSAADIALELFDDKLLLGDNGFYEIADGNHPTDFPGFDNWQMADP